MRTLQDIATALDRGQTSAAALAEQCLARATAPDGEGARVFVALDRDRIMAQAAASDKLRAHGIVPSPLAGIPVSVKDLFDVQGEVTRAGSRVLAGGKPALSDAPVIARLRAAGAVLFGRTNMSEFAYSGVGLNPHYGTPANPFDRNTGRVPGGSSSGAAVSVSDGMAAVALGTDTGGSCRIPAALCGTVGYKPTQFRISRNGCTPLSTSLDSIGSLGASVACVALVDRIMAGEYSYEDPSATRHLSLNGCRLGAPRTFVLDDLDNRVAQAYERALKLVSKAGASIHDVEMPLLTRISGLTKHGGIVAAEASAWHRDHIAAHGALYDPRVRARIEAGLTQSAADYIDVLSLRASLIAQFDAATAEFDALIMPTTPIVAPAISECEKDEEFRRLNGLLLRNSYIGNIMDRCAISLPCHLAGDAPVGLMLIGKHGADAPLLALAASIEQALGNARPEPSRTAPKH